MHDDLQDLACPRKKCKMQYPNAIVKAIIDECGLTDEECDVLTLRSRGYTVLEVSFKMEEKYGKRRFGGRYSEKTVERRIRSLKNKISDYIDLISM